ncbi:MAG: hypothetical protein ACTS4T_00845 [Candidatus Hodgkinia cicadicola]
MRSRPTEERTYFGRKFLRRTFIELVTQTKFLRSFFPTNSAGRFKL